MSNITLPGPSHTYHLRPTLQLVTDIETTGGNIFKIADQLVSQELGLNDILLLLTTAYKACDSDIDTHVISDYLLNDCPVAPALLLSDILVAILSPLQKMGAIEDNAQGKPIAAKA